MSHAVAEQGYASTTVAEIAARAEVSRNAFYRHFAGKRECFLAAFDAITADYMAAFATAYRTGGDASQGTAAGLRALFEVVAANPGALRVATVEIAGAGEEGIARREQLITGFEGFLRESLGLAPRRGTIANPI
ncbi:MAG TPA: helix-turn-helix domain-containing protein, partial [Solirubrobacteraceae bacterium]|nr:helix-turn-helix domain-containing protein [Solirubrobacteraceae bacterium]